MYLSAMPCSFVSQHSDGSRQYIMKKTTLEAALIRFWFYRCLGTWSSEKEIPQKLIKQWAPQDSSSN